MKREQLESIVVQAISEVTHISADDLSYNHSFDMYGLESVMMINIIRMLERELGELPKTLFFEQDNIKELVDYLYTNHVKEEEAVKKKEVLHMEPTNTLASLDTKEEESDREDELTNFTIDFNYPVDEKIQEDEIAIIGLSGKFPMADNLIEFWDNLAKGKDCIEEIPSTLWHWKEYFDEKRGTKGKSYSKWGGFIHDADKFDPLFFGISNLEAEMLDPQERIFLETVYHTLENAGYTPKTLSNKAVGVYVGVMWGQYQLYGEKYADAQSSYASIANRVSYYFDFHGPSIALDTMCSSSLTSLHLACSSIKSGECDVAIAGGVNLTVHPNKYIYLSKTGFASSDGRCRSFGEGGDGYVPGDGVGALLVKPLKKAIEDKDNIWGIVKSTTINHGGKAKNFTAPNPKAQTSLIKKGIAQANIEAKDFDYIEMHGTGTALGDPIEVRALNHAFMMESGDEIPIGSVKSNIGHLESAAGVAGIAKVLLQMKYSQLVPSIHSTPQNPNLNFNETPFYVQKELQPWENTHGKEKISGVSSFGAGGANAFVVLKEYHPNLRKPPISLKPYAILFSAKTKEQLKQKVIDMIHYLDAEYNMGEIESQVKEKVERFLGNIFLELGLNRKFMYNEDDISILGITYEILSKVENSLNCTREEFYLCKTVKDLQLLLEKVYLKETIAADSETIIQNITYTLQVGREGMKYRYGIFVNSIADLYSKLQDAMEEQSLFNFSIIKKETQLSNDKEIDKKIIEELILKENQVRLAQFWLVGVNITWERLYKGKNVTKISLPEYPFSKERCWVESNLEAEKQPNENERILLKGSYGSKKETLFEESDIIRYYSPLKEFSSYMTFFKQMDSVQEVKMDDRQILCIAKNIFSYKDIEHMLLFDLEYHQAGIQINQLNNGAKYVLIDLKKDTVIVNVVSEDRKLLYSFFLEANHPDISSCMYSPKWEEISMDLIPQTQEKVFIYDIKEEESIKELLSYRKEEVKRIALCDIEGSKEIDKNYLQVGYDSEYDWADFIEDNRIVYYFVLQKQLEKIEDFDLHRLNQEIIVPFWKVLKNLSENSKNTNITLVTNQVHKILKEDQITPQNSILNGIARSGGKEFTSIAVTIVDIDLYAGQPGNEISSILFSKFNRDCAIRNNKVFVRKMKPVKKLEESESYFATPRTIILVGGAGNVGRKITEYLLQKYDIKIIWVGRKSAEEIRNKAREQFSEKMDHIEYISADVTKKDAFIKAVKAHVGNRKIDAIMNLAMDFHIKRLSMIEDSRYFEKYLKAKVEGNIHLMNVALRLGIKKIVFFSSGEAFTGNIGWGVYSSSCVFSDTLKNYINDNTDCECLSINWGFWETDDSNTNNQFKNKGITPLDKHKGGYLFDKILSSHYDQLMALDVSETVKQRMGLTEGVQTNEEKDDNNERSEKNTFSDFQATDQIANQLKTIFSRVLKISMEKIQTDEDLANYGVDSLLITELHSGITNEFGEIPASVILETPTIDEMTEYIYKKQNAENTSIEMVKIVERGELKEYLRSYGNRYRNKELRSHSHMQKLDLSAIDSSTLKHMVLKVEGLEVEVFLCGEGKPLLMLPAIGLTAPIWIHQFADLSEKYMTIVIHVPGYGLSSVLSGAKTEEVGDLIVKILKRLMIHTKVNIVASCFGSIAASYLAANHSELFASLTLVGGFYDGSDLPSFDNSEMTIEQLQALTSEISKSIGKDFEHLLEVSNLNEPVIREAKDILLSCQCVNPLIAIRYLNEMAHLNTTDWLMKIRIPTACLYGAMDTVILPERSKYMHSIITHLFLHEFKTAGHYPFLTHKDAFNEILVNFIEEN